MSVSNCSQHWCCISFLHWHRQSLDKVGVFVTSSLSEPITNVFKNCGPKSRGLNGNWGEGVTWFQACILVLILLLSHWQLDCYCYYSYKNKVNHLRIGKTLRTRYFKKSPPKVTMYIITKTEPRYNIVPVKKVIRPWLDPHRWKTV